MGSLPMGRLVTVTVATPFVTVPVPSVVAPLVNVTVPVTPVGRVSVKVTGAPTVDGFCDEVRVEVGYIVVARGVQGGERGEVEVCGGGPCPTLTLYG